MTTGDPQTQPPEVTPIGSSRSAQLRFVAINLGLVLLLVGSAFDIVTGREHWPFSPYPMYSRIELDETMSQLRLFGIRASDGTEVILKDENLISPFDNSRLGVALQRIRLDNDSELSTAVADCLQRYQQARQRGDHEGPELVGIRLYELTWLLDPRADNRSTPDERAMIVEVLADPEGDQNP